MQLPILQLQSNRNRGFTIIELLIATGILSMLLLTISSLFLAFMVGSASTSGQQTLKAEGTQALTQIEFLLRNARRVTSPGCGDPPLDLNQLTIEGVDGGQTTFSTVSDKLASASAFPQSSGGYGTETLYNLTGEKVSLSNLNFRCLQNGSKRLVKVEFNLTHQSPNTELQEATTTKTFSTAVEIRNQ